MIRELLTILVGHLAVAASLLDAQVVVAHRGASFDAPENTLAAFQLAWEKGADAIEGDFYLACDNEIVCIHDDTTERVGGGRNLPVAGSTYAALGKIDVGSWMNQRFADQRIPRLCDVLGTVPSDKRIFIEVKCGPEIVPILKHALTKLRIPPEQTAIISFKEDVIDGAKKAMPDRQAFWLVGFGKDERTGWQPTAEHVVATAKAIHADGVSLQALPEVVNSRFVAACRDAALSVHVWTVDDEEVANHFQELGVDSITTNRPDFLRERLFPADARRRQVHRP